MNRAFERFSLGLLAQDQFKYLMLALGFQSPSDSEASTRTLAFMEYDTSLIPQDVTEKCHCILNQ